MVLIDASALSVSRPDKPLFLDLSITIHEGDRLGVVGINGCGKSTLLRILSGETQAESGIVRRGRGVRVAILEQDPKLAKGTVRTAAIDGLEGAATWEAEAVLDRLGMGGLLDADTSTLSGGQAKRVALARALVTESDLLILDEPTNHLDLDAIAWLEDRLARHRGALVMVSHDRLVLDKVCTKVLEIDRGDSFIHEGGYQGFLDGRAAREESAAASEQTRQNLARRELAWLRRGAPARSRKPKAHIDSAIALIEGGPKRAAREGSFGLAAATGRSGEGQRDSANAQGSFRNNLDESLSPRLGNKVIDLFDVGHRFGLASGEPGPWLFRDLNVLLDPGERYGIVGANGTGKSTLLDIISSRLVPVAGRVEVGPTVRVGYYDQRGRTLDLTQRVRDAVAGKTRVPGTPEDKRLMEQFWFNDDAQFAPVGTLSGGERRRLQLLLVLAERPNVLLLDEPTNDLDLDTLRALEDFLEGWPGTLVVVSHDRAFMDRTVEEVLSIEGGRAALVSGGYTGWRAQREARIALSTGTAGKTASVSGSAGSDTTVKISTPSKSALSGEAPVKRSSSTLRHLLKNAERDLSKATKERDKLTAELEAAGSNYEAAAAIGTKLAEVQARLDSAEELWLEVAAESEA
jgi:ABC transport system ATP-binding/permease protein